MMQHLNKERVPHHLLYNRVFPFAGLDECVFDTVNTTMLVQAWSELQRADYEFNDSDSTLNYEWLFPLIESENNAKRIPF